MLYPHNPLHYHDYTTYMKLWKYNVLEWCKLRYIPLYRDMSEETFFLFLEKGHCNLFLNTCNLWGVCQILPNSGEQSVQERLWSNVRFLDQSTRKPTWTLQNSYQRTKASTITVELRRHNLKYSKFLNVGKKPSWKETHWKCGKAKIWWKNVWDALERWWAPLTCHDKENL